MILRSSGRHPGDNHGTLEMTAAWFMRSPRGSCIDLSCDPRKFAGAASTSFFVRCSRHRSKMNYLQQRQVVNNRLQYKSRFECGRCWVKMLATTCRRIVCDYVCIAHHAENHHIHHSARWTPCTVGLPKSPASSPIPLIVHIAKVVHSLSIVGSLIEIIAVAEFAGWSCHRVGMTRPGSGPLSDEA